MKANENEDKSHLLVSAKKCITTDGSGFDREFNECRKLLGMKVDCKLRFFKLYYLDDLIKKLVTK